MSINLEKAMARAKAGLKKSPLQAVVLGSSGAGKSSLLGTMGVKTLYLHATGEDHGPRAATALGGDNVVSICIDQDDDGKELQADKVFELIKSICRNSDFIKANKFSAIVLDGFAVLEHLAKKTTAWKTKCLTSAGKHNTYKESESTLDVITEVIDSLKNAQRELGVHIAVTCMLDVKGMANDGSITEAAPRLAGYGLAEGLIQQFGDVLVVGKVTKNNVSKYKLQFLTDLSKSSKDEQGDLKKAMNFSPRISGAINLPAFMDADLAAVIKFKVETIK